MQIGFVGAGRMGWPMLGRIAAAGFQAKVLVRRTQAREAAEAAGLDWADTLTATVNDADVVFIVVQNDEQVRSVCFGTDAVLAGMKPGAMLVQHTTCDPTTVERIAIEAAERSLRVLDAALSGGPHDIAAGTLTLWVGGEQADLEELRPLLRTYADSITCVGAVGDGQRVKLVNNALFVAQVGLAIDAVRLAGSLGIAEQTILAALQDGSGASRALGVVARAGSVDAVAERLSELMRKDVHVVREVARRMGVDLGILGTVLSSDAVEKKVLDPMHAKNRVKGAIT
jgi:3-hydroxyisobutyrate dehydrogenase-like beta-hydroxyacid dehydrogenase